MFNLKQLLLAGNATVEKIKGDEEFVNVKVNFTQKVYTRDYKAAKYDIDSEVASLNATDGEAVKANFEEQKAKAAAVKVELDKITI